MKLKQFCCDANKDLYEQYYSDQCGSGMPFTRVLKCNVVMVLGVCLVGYLEMYDH